MENNNLENKEINSKSSNIILAVLLILVLVVTCGYFVYTEFSSNNDTNKQKDTNKNVVDKKEVSSEYRMSGNGLEKFDLAFLKLENNGKNAVYSPLSIKYALEMLAEGADGETKAQLDAVIGDYVAKKYENSKNMSFANAMFVKNTFKDSIKTTYTDLLKNKYNADVVYDSFKTSDNLNKWVSDKTLGLISKPFDDVSTKDFILMNALGIDMSWTNQIQCAVSKNDIPCELYYFSYSHENYSRFINPIETESDYPVTKFENGINAKSVQIGVSVNKYDIVNTLGRENIYNQITSEYNEWLVDGKNPCSGEVEDKDTIAKYVNQFIDGLNTNYKRIDKSTDLYFYDDEEIKAFAKDLKEYNGTQLQYVGIMPKTTALKDYIDKIDSNSLNNVIKSLKDISLGSFEEGVVTEIVGTIPLFKMNYELNLVEDLNKLGIVDVFDNTKADLSNLSSAKGSSIVDASHKANIEFSNEGIKAAALTEGGGLGDASCGFEHLYEVPVKKIDLTFDKPFLYLIRDKKSGEVWFVGTVYEPTKSLKTE